MTFLGEPDGALGFFPPLTKCIRKWAQGHRVPGYYYCFGRDAYILVRPRRQTAYSSMHRSWTNTMGDLHICWDAEGANKRRDVRNAANGRPLKTIVPPEEGCSTGGLVHGCARNTPGSFTTRHVTEAGAPSHLVASVPT